MSAAFPLLTPELGDWAARQDPVALVRAYEVARSDSVRIGRNLAEQARQRRLRDIDRRLARRSDSLGDLARRGSRVAQETHEAQRVHRLRVEWRSGWRPVCSCGWQDSRPWSRKENAEGAMQSERTALFAPLRPTIEHTNRPAEVDPWTRPRMAAGVAS